MRSASCSMACRRASASPPYSECSSSLSFSPGGFIRFVLLPAYHLIVCTLLLVYVSDAILFDVFCNLFRQCLALSHVEPANEVPVRPGPITVKATPVPRQINIHRL